MRAKKRGRPATGQGVPVHVRFQKPLMRAVDEWLDSHPAAQTRADAIRRLVEAGLATADAPALTRVSGAKANKRSTAQRQR
jgi:hypothetical protein